MKKRLFFLVLLAFLLCGCSANVNITINGNTVNERISIQEAPYGQATMNDVAQQYRKYIPAFKDTIIVDTMPDTAVEGVKYYKTSSTEINGMYNAYYQYDYNFRDYKNATSINNAFKSSMVQFDAYEKKILITTESSGMVLFNSYPMLDEVRINISTNYPVLENNADYSSGNVYTWIFNRETSKGVYLLLEDLDGKSVGGQENTNNEDNKEDDEEEEGNKPDNNNAGKNNNNKGTKKEEDKSSIEKGLDKIQKEGKKHPYMVAIIGIVLFIFVVLISFRIKKV